MNMVLKILKKEKKKIVFVGIICLSLSFLVMSIYPKKKYSVEFTVNINHVFFKQYDVSNNVSGIVDLINTTKIDSNIPIKLTYQKLSKTYIAKSNIQNLDKELDIIIRQAVEVELDKMFYLLDDLESNRQINSLQSYNGGALVPNDNGIFKWSAQDILRLDKKSILDKLTIKFGKVKKNYNDIITMIFSFIFGVYISILYFLRSKN